MAVALKLRNIQPRRWTVDEYHRLYENGVFGGDDRFELIDGQIVPMSMPSPPHTRSLMRVNRALSSALGTTHYVAPQCPIELSLYSEPRPDYALYPVAAVDVPSGEPARAELLVEVSDTSLEFDSNEKGYLYAAAGVPEYWILRVQERRLEVRRDPGPTKRAAYRIGYRSVAILEEADTVSPLCRPDVTIRVADLL